MPTAFEVLAQPIRRAILDLLRDRERLVGDLADALALTQPLTSKHLRVLREAGLVSQVDYGNSRKVRLRRADLQQRFPGLLDLIAAEE